jgi:hypothetical protein
MLDDVEHRSAARAPQGVASGLLGVTDVSRNRGVATLQWAESTTPLGPRVRTARASRRRLPNRKRASDD